MSAMLLQSQKAKATESGTSYEQSSRKPPFLGAFFLPVLKSHHVITYQHGAIMDIAQLGISVDSRQVKNATGDLSGLTNASRKAEAETDRLSSATKAFGGVLAGVGFAAAASQAIKLADAYNKLSARVGMATNDLAKADEKMRQIYATAQSVNAPLQEMGDLFTKMAPSVSRMGGSFKETNAIAEAFALTLKNSGASAQQTAAAILQFGQAMDKGKINGDEFVSMAENNGYFLNLLSKQLGVTRGELAQMSSEGKLTSDVMGNVLLGSVEELRQSFEKMPVSVEDATVRVGNSLQLMAAKSDIVNATSSVLSETLMLVSETMDGVSLATEQAATESERLASENSAQTWAESGARLIAILSDSVDGVKFAFIAVGKTLGALAAAAITSLSAIGSGISGVFNAIKSGDFAAAGAAVSGSLSQIASTKAIWSAYTADIEHAAGAVGKHQAALDRSLSGVQTKVKPATDGFKKLAGATTDSGKASEKAAKAAARAAEQAADAYGDIERSLSKQLMTEEELTTAQKVAMDLTDKRYKHLSEKQKANLIALAKEVDAFKAQQQLFKDMAASAQELSESDTKRQQAAVDAAYASYQAVDQQLKKLQEEADTYGMTETEIQRYLLAKAEEKLALEQGGEARQGVIDQLNREIETRKELVSATSGSEMRKATDALGERVQGTLADAIKDGLAADNPIKGFAKSLGNSVKNALMNAVANGLSARIMAALGMGGASGAAAASGSGDIFSLGSDAKQIYDMFSGASVGNSASGALQAFSTSSAGQYFGLSDATGSLTQAGADLTVEVGNFADAVNTYAGYAKAAYDVYSAFKDGEGWGAAAGSVIGAYFGGGVGAAIGNKIGSMVDSAFSGGGGEKSGGNYNAAFVGGMATSENFFGGYTPSQADAQLKTAVNDFYKNYTQTVKDLGGVAKDLTVNLGFDTDPAGSAGNRLSAQVAVGAVTAGERELWQQSVLSMVSESVGEIPEAINLATGKMLLAALKESELPAEYARVFNGVDIKSATQEQINAMQNALAAIRTLNTAFDNFGKTLPQLAGLTYEAKEAIATFGGGIETFSGSLNSYVDLYYSDAEKASMATKQLQSQFSQLNITMPASTAEFRSMVEAQDLTTESGRKTYAALISLSGAFDSAADAAKAANEALLTSALSTLADSIAAEQEAINAAADAAIEGYEKQIEAQQALADAAEKSAASISEVIGILQSGITSLRGYSFEQGRSFITSAIAQARAGGVPDKEQLSAAVDAVKAIDESGFGTREELERVKASAAADMDTLQAIAGNQLTTAQRQANAAEEQIKRLNALIESTIDSRDRQLESLDLLYQTQEKQVNVLLGIQSATLSVEESISALSIAVSSLKPPSASLPINNGSTGAAGSAIDQIYRDVLGREADVAGLNFYGAQLLAGKSIDQIRAEIAASEEAKAINGSHRNGLASVPFDGYRAELHAGERVLTAQQADSSDKMAADIAEMRREVSAAMYAIAANTLRTAKLQERWDGDGLPDPRGY